MITRANDPSQVDKSRVLQFAIVTTCNIVKVDPVPRRDLPYCLPMPSQSSAAFQLHSSPTPKSTHKSATTTVNDASVSRTSPPPYSTSNCDQWMTMCVNLKKKDNYRGKPLKQKQKIPVKFTSKRYYCVQCSTKSKDNLFFLTTLQCISLVFG